MTFTELPDLVHMYDLSLGKTAIAEMRRKFGHKQLQESCSGTFTDKVAREVLSHDVMDHAAAIHDELLLLLAGIVAKQQTMFKDDATKRDIRRVVTGQMMENCITLMIYSIVDDLKHNSDFRGFEELGVEMTENIKDMAFVAARGETIRNAQKALATLTRSVVDEFMSVYCKEVHDKRKET